MRYVKDYYKNKITFVLSVIYFEKSILCPENISFTKSVYFKTSNLLTQY
jgi:hypothetical protein